MGRGGRPSLDGMFASVVWTGECAYLAVDHFGEKPLYYAETEDGVYVSSELPPLVRLLGLTPSLSPEALAAYLSLGYVPPPETAFLSVHRMPAATIAEIRGGTVAKTCTYWTPPLGTPGRGRPRPLGEDDLTRLQEALSESLQGRLIADVPLCIFLSAGIDSALVAAMAQRDFDSELECVSVSFPDDGGDDEAPMAAETARFLGLAHRVVRAAPRSRGGDVEQLIELFGQPCDAATALSIRQMTGAVSGLFKVGLTGSGGDEVSFGYGKHSHFYRRRYLYNLPQPLRLAIGGLAGRLRGLSHSAGRIADVVGVRDEERYLAQKNDPAIAWLRGLPGFPEWCRDDLTDGGERLEFAVMRYELSDVMPGLRLASMDLGSMSSSVELRTPFLSRRLVETVAEFDPRAFVAFGQKSVLRRLLRRYLPDHLVDRPKRGFIFPQERLLEAHRDAPPPVPLLEASAAAEVWRRLGEGGGWQRIAVRMVVLSAFLNWTQTGERDAGTTAVAAGGAQ